VNRCQRWHATLARPAPQQSGCEGDPGDSGGEHHDRGDTVLPWANGGDHGLADDSRLGFLGVSACLGKGGSPPADGAGERFVDLVRRRLQSWGAGWTGGARDLFVDPIRRRLRSRAAGCNGRALFGVRLGLPAGASRPRGSHGPLTARRRNDRGFLSRTCATSSGWLVNRCRGRNLCLGARVPGGCLRGRFCRPSIALRSTGVRALGSRLA